jgi:hypothetical protein
MVARYNSLMVVGVYTALALMVLAQLVSAA